MNTKKTKEIISIKMLVGLSVAFATSLCFLEYGEPYVARVAHWSGFDQEEVIEIEVPITRPKLPTPPVPPAKTSTVLVAMIDPSKISAEPADPRNDLPDFDFDIDKDLYFLPAKEEPIDDNTPFVIVEEMPQFPGGEEALLKFLSKNVKYPGLMRDMGLSGIVYTKFVVDKKGNVNPESIEIVDSTHPLFAEAAMTALKKMPTWRPGKQRGKPVNVYYSLPVRFNLK